MKKKIYAYYESIQILPQTEEFACANWWKTSWEKNGWECVMLNRSHAQSSNLHQKLMGKLMKFSFALPQDMQPYFPLIAARYSRWCALHAAGGGWMSDYDVMNLGFSCNDSDSHESTLSVVSGEPAYLFYATKEHCAAAIQKFINEDLICESKLRFECDILNPQTNLSGIIDKVHHARKSDKKKSEIMQELA